MTNPENTDKSRQVPKRRAFVPSGKHFLSREIAQSFFPMVEVVDPTTGEVFSAYQYKVVFQWQEKFMSDPHKPEYTYPDYMVLQEYYRHHGNMKNKSFTDLVRSLILKREFKCQSVIVYDNTGIISGNVMYQSVLDPASNKHEYEINYLFPTRPNYRIHPRYIQK
ncbi:MAG: hypothetical protein K9H61_02380 [Bacteroidia bacterium]|nr:hypothetical protein [Bacteroidia bacterium]MCF8427173.1 hypothetical protein [Bacteroidia bacterium]MCF8445818.1 hypothetical protein [Bacteroidia bacterium]